MIVKYEIDISKNDIDQFSILIYFYFTERPMTIHVHVVNYKEEPMFIISKTVAIDLSGQQTDGHEGEDLISSVNHFSSPRF